MNNRIENFLKNLSLEQLVIARDTANNLIEDFSDGYLYICEVRSYGRNWKNRVKNIKALQDLCYQYDGDDGIVDVYSNSPNLDTLYNYGDVKYIPTEEDYEKWKSYSYLKRIIPKIEEEWEEWDNRENVPFRARPTFEPLYSKEHLLHLKKELENFDMNFEMPVTVEYNYPDEEEQ